MNPTINWVALFCRSAHLALRAWDPLRDADFAPQFELRPRLNVVSPRPEAGRETDAFKFQPDGSLAASLCFLTSVDAPIPGTMADKYGASHTGRYFNTRVQVPRAGLGSDRRICE